MADTEQKVVFTGDASQLINTVEKLIISLGEANDEFVALKKAKEDTTEVEEKIANQTLELNDILKDNKDVLDNLNLSYNQINKGVKAAERGFKSVGDAASRSQLAPTVKALNGAMKTMDASIGNYQRNVGNYAGDMEKAMNAVRVNTMQVVRELPSLSFGIEQFLVAISNNIPMLIDSLQQLRKVNKAAAAEQVNQNAEEIASQNAVTSSAIANVGTKKVLTAANVTNRKAVDELTAAEIEENKVTKKATELDNTHSVSLGELETRIKRITQANIRHRLSLLNESDAQKAQMKLIEQYNKIHHTSIKTWEDYIKVTESAIRVHQKVLLRQEGVTIATEETTDAVKNAGDAVEDAGKKTEKTTKTVSGFKTALKSLFDVSSVITLLLLLLIVFSKQLIAAVNGWIELGRQQKEYNRIASQTSMNLEELSGSITSTYAAQKKLNQEMLNNNNYTGLSYKSHKKLNEAMNEGAKSMAKEYVELRLLTSIIADASKSTEDHTKAASKLLEMLGEENTETGRLAVQTGLYDDKVQNLIKTLYAQAQAQGAIKLLEEQYSNTVLKAQGELIDAQLNQAQNKIGSFKNWLGMVFNFKGGAMSKEDYLSWKVNDWEEKLKVAQTNFEAYLAEIAKLFNFDEMFGKGEQGGKGKDDWFSRWELYINEMETKLGNLIGKNGSLDLGNIWKFSKEGYNTYMKKFDEIANHYKKDEKQYRETLIAKQQYINEFNNYNAKLILQWSDTNKTEREKDIENLEEWHNQQVIIYEEAGADTTNLTDEYNNRKEEIERKYRDKSYIDLLDGMERELEALKNNYEDELYEYDKKGIESVDLTLKYEKEKAAIISKYAAENTQKQIERFNAEAGYLNRQNDLSYRGSELGGQTELTYATLGGTSMSEGGRVQNQMDSTMNEYSIWSSTKQAEIQAMQEVLDSGKLVGEERIEMEQQIADASMELELGTAEYSMEMQELKLEKAKATTKDILEYSEKGLQGMGDLFSNVYSAIETSMEAEVEAGRMTEEEAEKEMEKYKGIKAMGAAMDALSSAVGAYSSMASIPVVGPALGAAAAAAALAAGMANVKLIMATNESNASSVGNSSSFVGATPSLSDYQPNYVTNVTSKSDTDYLANSLSDVNIQVSVTDINEVQNRVKVRENEATF